MDGFLRFEECVRDSPSFRQSLEQHESDVEELEGRIEKVVKLCSRMVEAGQAYAECNQLFLSALAEFTHYNKHTVIANCLRQFNHGLQEMIHFHTMLLDQSQRAITQQLTHLLSQFLPQMREAQREFVRIGGDVELAAVKNAQITPNKPAEAERASHLLIATRKCFQHFALDYCLQLNNFKVQQKLDILNSVFSYFHAQYTFFHQGFDLLRDLEPTMKTMASELAQLSTECTAKRKDLENQHLVVQQRDACGESVVVLSPSTAGVIQGYLFKRSRRKNKTWKRCWFSTNNNQLLYTKTHKEQPVVLFDDLRLCAVKSLDSIDRRFCFELLSVQKCCVLQADSEELKMAWINAVQSCIDIAYREKESEHTQVKPSPPVPVPDPPSLPAALGVAVRGHGNHRCCDCGEAEPRWASVNLGITVCIECSGIHRSLGVHLSKVRSLTLDSWDPEQLKLLCVLGNDVINSIYECSPSDGLTKPDPQSSRQVKEVWIRRKYVERSFVKKDCESADAENLKMRVGQKLYQAVLDGELVTMATALAQGADVNWSNPEEAGRTALIGAAIGGSLLACEFLLQNGANVNYRDQHGQAALHAAATRGHTGQVCLLLKRGANQYAADEKGKDPLSIAIETAHADIVTLLRMARMNEEMRDSEGFFGSIGDDETFQDIFRDFSDMASHDPERLSRRQFSRNTEEEGVDETAGGAERIAGGMEG
ncbi:BAR_ACAPs and ArfGap_ACAP domain-containing protein [Pygocentrus nattereri]|uniref:Arf-GAP with coiled-coil, ANK repeat and PH domain-containing protein n=1 Tax=Pygocentrus nattereri TaxID=42514 RepID=A0A3B4D546_PYGNA|nr:BAR_ACAPs and ArfGap_ACAP domain-containing protein [Pygocentrus nattereri]